MKRQGWSPPWVELQNDIEKEIASFRSRTRDNWVRRAGRMILASAALTSSCDPLPTEVLRQAWEKAQEVDAQATADKKLTLSGTPPASGSSSSKVDTTHADAAHLDHLQSYVSTSNALPGHAMLLEICKSYRDAEWVEKELKYHSLELMDLNVKIRRFNGLAPYHTRRSLLDRETELDRIFRQAPGRLAMQVSQDLRDKREGRDRTGAGPTAKRKPREKPTYDIWGNEVITPAPVEPVQTDFFDLQPQRGAGGGSDRGSGGGGAAWADDQGHQSPSSGIGIGLLLRRTSDWVRSRVGL